MTGLALVIGASGGIGKALAVELTAEGLTVTGLSRSEDGLDVTEEDSVIQHLQALQGPFRRIVVTTGALEIDGAAPEKALKQVTPEAMLAQFRLNALGPALVLKHAARLLPKTEPSVIAVLSARVGSIGDNQLGGWISYRSAKAAVNQIVRTAAIELARTHPGAICVALHPGTVKTAFTEKYLGRHAAVDPRDAARNLIRVMDGLESSDSGGFFDWAGKTVSW